MCFLLCSFVFTVLIAFFEKLFMFSTFHVIVFFGNFASNLRIFHKASQQ